MRLFARGLQDAVSDEGHAAVGVDGRGLVETVSLPPLFNTIMSGVAAAGAVPSWASVADGQRAAEDAGGARERVRSAQGQLAGARFGDALGGRAVGNDAAEGQRAGDGNRDLCGWFRPPCPARWRRFPGSGFACR